MILTLKELAEHLKVNERTILRMIKNGQIVGTKIGGQWRFNGSQIDRVFFPGESSTDESEAVPLSDLTHSQIGIPVSRTMDTNRMLMDLKSDSIEGIIEEMTAPKLFNDLVLDTRDLQEKCIAREKLQSTTVGNGIAVPHPRDPVTTLQVPGCVTYGFSKKGVDFNAIDDKPVHMFFLVCSQNIDLHLHLMGSLAHILSSKDFVQTCMNATSSEEIMKAVIAEESKQFLHRTKVTEAE